MLPSMSSPRYRKPDQAVLLHSCVVCKSETVSRRDPALWRCRTCGYWGSIFPAAAVDANRSAIDEERRIAALAGLRTANSQTIFRALARHVPLAGARLCDVGCAYGWFLKTAEEFGVRGLGIEAEAPVADAAQGQGVNVRTGFFPDCLSDNERFEIITFNDVLEHLPEIDRVLEVCHRHLVARGLLSIVIPSSRGSVFRLGGALARVGIRGPWDRLWQRDFSCPHVHYFNATNLAALVQRHGFELLDSQSLPSLRIKGLWSRLRMDANSKFLPSLAGWTGMVLLSPLLRVTPSDILFQIYRRTEERT
jgi:2-polyprenyl-3-methyl-5-hydroxy-6-metoxy-1,4-benzoquinol methylase